MVFFCPDGITPNSGLTGPNNTIYNICIYMNVAYFNKNDKRYMDCNNHVVSLVMHFFTWSHSQKIKKKDFFSQILFSSSIEKKFYSENLSDLNLLFFIESNDDERDHVYYMVKWSLTETRV